MSRRGHRCKTLLAQRLHMSRPAVYARLARIERVGADLDDGESRVALHLAVLVMDARPGERPTRT